MKGSDFIVISVTTKHRTSRLLGFINNQNTGRSNLNVNNVSTKQQKRSSEGAHSIETQGGTFDCDQCEYKATIKSHLRVHTLSKRERIKFDCDQCEHKANHKDSLRLHKQSKHEGIKYNCDQWEYKATTKSNLRVHTLSKHEVIKFDCEQCEYKATKKARVRTILKHEGTRFYCDQCEYKCVHKQSKHESIVLANS